MRKLNPAAIALTGGFVICLGALIFALIQFSSQDPADTERIPEITEFHESEPQRYEPIVPWTDDDDTADNPYYKRITDEDGVPVFAVQRASDKQMAYLPIESTILYVGDDISFYEERMLYYTQDGEEKEVKQYQLHIQESQEPQKSQESQEQQDQE